MKSFIYCLCTFDLWMPVWISVRVRARVPRPPPSGSCEFAVLVSCLLWAVLGQLKTSRFSSPAANPHSRGEIGGLLLMLFNPQTKLIRAKPAAVAKVVVYHVLWYAMRSRLLSGCGIPCSCFAVETYAPVAKVVVYHVLWYTMKSL